MQRDKLSDRSSASRSVNAMDQKCRNKVQSPLDLSTLEIRESRDLRDKVLLTDFLLHKFSVIKRILGHFWKRSSRDLRDRFFGKSHQKLAENAIFE